MLHIKATEQVLSTSFLFRQTQDKANQFLEHFWVVLQVIL